MISFDTMGAGVCSALAQLAPVFMVLLVAERVVFTTGEDDDTVDDLLDNDEFWLGTGRIVVDLLLAAMCAFLTISALIGIEEVGFVGGYAAAMWVITFALIGLVILRWLFLATPLSTVFTGYLRAQARMMFNTAEGLRDGLIEVPALLAAFPRDLVALFADFARAFVQLAGAVVSVGTAGREPNHVAVTKRRRRRRRGPVR